MTHFVYSYPDKYSIDQNPENNWNIGKQYNLVGNNIAAGLKDNTWVVLKTKETYTLGFTGKLIRKETQLQPWKNYPGGKQWKHIYECSHYLWLGNLSDFCDQHHLDKQMFIQSLRFGHPKSEWIPAFNRAASIVREHNS
jgi:hypothetical protein